nr:hypothetical protein CFP56_56491 [Quercus suber]
MSSSTLVPTRVSKVDEQNLEYILASDSSLGGLMRKPEVQPLVSLVFRGEQVLLLLFPAHLTPDGISLSER